MGLSALTAICNHVGVKPASTAVWASLSMAAPRDARGLDSVEASGVGPFGFLTARGVNAENESRKTLTHRDGSSRRCRDVLTQRESPRRRRKPEFRARRSPG